VSTGPVVTVQTGTSLKTRPHITQELDFWANTTSQSGVRHFNAIAGDDSCKYRHKWYIAKTRFFGLNFCRRKCLRASCHDWSTMKPTLSKSAFFEGVRHFERQFQIDGDVDRNRSMNRWIGEWCSYNFAAGSFYTKKLCSRLFSREVEFYWHKQQNRVFVPPFGGLRGNVHGSSMARWKARGRLPISANW